MGATILGALATLGAALLKAFISAPPPIAAVSQNLGIQSQVATDNQAALKAETAIAQSEANAPTKDSVIASLKAGTF